MTIDLRDELRRRYGSDRETARVAAPSRFGVEDRTVGQAALPVQSTPERAFVLDAASGRTVIAGPLNEISTVNPGFLYLHGRFVEADQPNRNGAMWSTDDLEIGHATVAGGPLNWLHQETNIIGALMSSDLQPAGDDVNAHITSTAVVWKFLFGGVAATIEHAAMEGRLWYSMECLSRAVQCVDLPGRPGCGEEFSYGDYDAKRACAHLNSRSSVRRFVDPFFLGGAIIVPPVEPGWARADVEVVRQAAALSEREGLSNSGALSETQARDMVAGILSWANR